MKRYMVPILSIVGLIIVIFVLVLVVNSNTTKNTNVDTDTNIGTSPISGYVTAAQIIKKDVNMDNQNANPIVVISTTKGDIEIELDSTKAPITVNNFKSYVSGGFYENTVFHRVIKGFMIQGGGFTGDGVQKDVMAPIAIESNNGLSNLTGTIAMARTNDPNSATSQFFINVVDNKFLDYTSSANPGYAVFGKVISGMDVVYAIENSSTSTKLGIYQDWPVDNVVITKVYFK